MGVFNREGEGPGGGGEGGKAGPLRKNNFFEDLETYKKGPMTTKFEGRGALVIGPLVEELFLQLPLCIVFMAVRF